MKKVLFPFEVDVAAYKEAYIYAVSLARNLRAELILLNAFYVEADNSITRSKYTQLLKNNWFKAYKELNLFHEYYLKNHASIEAELRLKTDHRFLHGNLVDEFRIILNKNTIDLVVIPAADENDSTRRKIRQMRREVLDMNSTSLLITPAETSYRPIHNILYIYSEKEQRVICEHLDEIMHATNTSDATIHLVHLAKHGMTEREQDQEALKSAIKEICRQNRVVFHLLQEKNQRKEIREYVSRYDIQVLSLPLSQLHSMGNLFRRHLIEDMGLIHKIPVWLLAKQIT